MLRTLSIVAGLLAASAFSCLRAQTLSAPQWANVPFTERGKVPEDIRAFCVEGVTYAFADVVAYKDEYVGYIFPKDEPVVRREVELPKQSGQNIYSAFCVVGNTPCVVYTNRDKKTAEVSLFLQAFNSSSFAPEGAPMKLGDLPLTKAYDGSTIRVSALPSPDRSKMLFLCEDIAQGGVKLAMCWVLDKDLNPVWSSQYRIPKLAYGSFTQSYFMDDGRLYMKVFGLNLTEELVKEQKDGSFVPRSNQEPGEWKNRSSDWYSMQGDAFHTWDFSVPGLPGTFSGTPVMQDGQVVMVGMMAQKGGPEDEGTYVLLGMGDDLTPHVIKSGKTSFRYGAITAMTSEAGNIYIALGRVDEMHMIKLNAAGDLIWEGSSVKISDHVKVVGDQVVYTRNASKVTFNEMLKGKIKSYPAGDQFPVMHTWEADGKTTVRRIFPEDAKVTSLPFTGIPFDDCGCYVTMSEDKKRPGLVRVCLEE